MPPENRPASAIEDFNQHNVTFLHILHLLMDAPIGFPERIAPKDISYAKMSAIYRCYIRNCPHFPKSVGNFC